MAAPKKQIKPKIKANLKKFILLVIFIKKFKLRNPTMKLIAKAGQPERAKDGLLKKRKMLEAKTTGADII